MNAVSKNDTRVAVLILTKNEAPVIGKLIEFLNGYANKVIVIDGNSSDRTCQIAEKCGAELFKVEGNGKGHDLRLFQEYVQKHPQDFDIYVMLDGDMTYDPKEISKVIEPIKKNEADVVIGSRFDIVNPEHGSIRRVRKFGNTLLAHVSNFLYKRNDITDVCSGYWGFSKDFFTNAPLSSEKFDLECDIFNYAARNCRLKTVPIQLRKRVGYSKLSLPEACKIPFHFAKYYGLNLLKDSK